MVAIFWLGRGRVGIKRVVGGEETEVEAELERIVSILRGGIELSKACTARKRNSGLAMQVYVSFTQALNACNY